MCRSASRRPWPRWSCPRARRSSIAPMRARKTAGRTVRQQVPHGPTRAFTTVRALWMTPLWTTCLMTLTVRQQVPHGATWENRSFPQVAPRRTPPWHGRVRRYPYGIPKPLPHYVRKRVLQSKPDRRARPALPQRRRRRSGRLRSAPGALTNPGPGGGAPGRRRPGPREHRAPSAATPPTVPAVPAVLLRGPGRAGMAPGPGSGAGGAGRMLVGPRDATGAPATGPGAPPGTPPRPPEAIGMPRM